MRKKIFYSGLLLGTLILLLCVGLFFTFLHRYYEAQVFSKLAVEAGDVAHGTALFGDRYLSGLQTEDRITWVAADGTVIYDSAADPAAMGNHQNREEIREALDTGVGESVHISETLLEKTLYYALRMEDGSVLRASCTQKTAVSLLLRLATPMVWLLIFVLLLCALLAARLSRQIVQPINALDLDDPKNPYGELQPLVARISQQNRTIRSQMETLSRQQREFTAITENMQEGFLLLSPKGAVLSGNHRELVEGGLQGPMREVAEQAISGIHTERLWEQDGVTRKVIGNPVVSCGQVTGAVLLLLDVTEQARREALRQEFTANVSHELKTPLTSISGFAELMKEGLVPVEKMREFSSDIYGEAQRLLALISDIINLSRLDENDVQEKWEEVDLYDLSQKTLDTVQAAADARGVTLQLRGEREMVRGVPQILGEMVYNLCDNAVQYNRKGGSVTVTVDGYGGAVRLTVEDTGIGIPYHEQGRIFERFYRVDKSRSKSSGGTGLGLSIVKHAAAFHHAQVSLISTPEQGSKFTVTF